MDYKVVVAVSNLRFKLKAMRADQEKLKVSGLPVLEIRSGNGVKSFPLTLRLTP